MATTALIIAVISFIAYIIFKSINRYFAYAYLFLIFVFAFVVSNREFSIFYILLFLIAIIISEFSTKIRTEQQILSMQEGKFTSQGFNFILLSLGLGLIIYLFIAVISTVKGGNIVGAPNLQVTTGGIAQLFKPTFESMLGVIENYFFFVIFDLLLIFGILIPLIGWVVELTFIILPTLITAFLAGILHVAAYSVNVGLILWAMIAFALFLLARFYTGDSLAADTSHFLNNLVISVQRGLAIVI